MRLKKVIKGIKGIDEGKLVAFKGVSGSKISWVKKGIFYEIANIFPNPNSQITLMTSEHLSPYM